MIIALQTLIFFRESVLAVLERWIPPLGPLFRQLLLTFSRNGLAIEDEETEDMVFAEYTDDGGVMFFPPVYAQRYAAVCDCLMDERWYEKLEKVVNMGRHHDMNFIKYLTEVPGIKQILGVDIDATLTCTSDLLDFTFDNYGKKWGKPLRVTLFQGNAVDPDYRLIGCDAVVAIEMIEYMKPHDLDRLVHNVFGFIKPWIAIFTTTNADFNVVFKSLEKSGLRRLDHYFEWTREQLHDWCSNIVTRYPGYTVACRGVGPGPPGTLHYGCCSQLVLFVAKDYHKQMELNVNSLALVADLPQPSPICDFESDWESPRIDISSNNMLCGYTDDESSTALPYPEYCSCYGTESPAESITTMHHSKASQCNLDSELGKSFVMYDMEDMYEVMWPRNKSNGRVYEIGDVADSLNNTMFVVNKFSKTTQNLLDGEEMNYLVHTRGVMDEVSHLTKMLNFTNCLTQGEECHIWNNINWGDNAPYWNQYYKVVAVYNYPYEIKSDDNLILDLILDEINKLLDTRYDEEYSVHVSKLEIPIYKLMETVKHVTEDVDRVIDLLEYNGYEIDGDVLIYSRVVVDDGSVTTRDEWPDNETYSDWDTTDVNSTITDGSNMPMDFDGRSLRRALDHKVKKLRAMFTHDEDITRELNQVVCRLLKIALSSSRGRQAPVQPKWLQCKLLDLLTLTEKAIVRRKTRFIERYPLNAIGYDTQDDTTTSEMVELCKIQADDTALRIVEKYRHLVQAPDNDIIVDKNNECYDENGLRIEFSTTLSSISTKLSDCHGEQNTVTDSEVMHESLIRESSILGDIDCFPDFSVPSSRMDDENHVSKRIQSLVNPYLPYPVDTYGRMISSGDDQSSSKSRTKRSKTRKSHRNHKLALMKNKNTLLNMEMGTFKIPKSKTYIKKPKIKSKRDSKIKNSNTLLTKKIMKTKSSYKSLVRKLSNKATGCEISRTSVSNFKTNLVKPIENTKDQTIVQLTAPKPIPDSIIELCQPGIRAQKHYQELNLTLEGSSIDAVAVEPSIAATKESLLIGIVTDETLETVAMRRTVGTDPGLDTESYEQELELTNVTSIINDDACYEKTLISTRIINSDTIFLFDINEPTTSKGLRHVSMDVQCGTDSFVPNYASLSATTSLAALPKMYTTGIKIGDSFPDVRADNTSDFGTSTHDTNENCAVISPRIKSVDIKIQDSDTQVRNLSIDTKLKNDSNLEEISKYIYENQAKVFSEGLDQITKETDLQSTEISECFTTHHSKTCIDEFISRNITSTEMLKPVCSHIKIEDSCSEFNGSFCSVPKSVLLGVRFARELGNSRVLMPRFITSKSVRPKLSCGGVHLHSYMDPQISEDVVFQGEWQQGRLKTSVRKKSYNSGVLKRNKDWASKTINGVPKDKLDPKKKPDLESGKQIDRKAKVVPIQKHHVKVTKLKDNIDNKIPLRKIAPTSVKPSRPPWKPVRKVSSKIGMSNVQQKYTSRTTPQPMRRAKSVPPDLKSKDKELQGMLPLQKYIPSYLSRMPKRVPGQKYEKNKFATMKDAPAIIKINKEIKEPSSPPSKALDIKAVLLNIPNEPRENVSYVVFRNEIENSNSRTGLGETTVSARPSDRGNPVKGNSPGSPNSSTCSTPNSVATVRPAVWHKPFSSRRHSTPNNKANVPRSGSDNKISSRIKRFIKKSKVSKKESKKDIENKENLPESSASSNLKSKDTDRAVSGGLVGTSNTIYTAQFLSGSHTPNKSSMKIPFVKSYEDKNKPVVNDEKKDECSIQDTDMVLVLEPCRIKSDTQIPPVTPTVQEWIVGSSEKAEEGNKNNHLTAMKKLIEEHLDSIDTSDNFQNIDSKTVILTPNRSTTKSLNDTSISASASFNTVVDNKSETFHSAVGTVNDTAEKMDNTSILSLPRSSALTENTDLLSFKSVASLSKFSDCFADNESYNDFNSICNDGYEVQDLYERKETILTQSEPGPLAIQAFSGYSMNADPVAGDQPDYVNLIDSETGSAAYEATTRLATSEEVFVSGRSSGSFASCVLDDDSVVPNWLFQIISQHHSQSFNALHPQENPDMQPEHPMPFAVDLDENSNEVGLAVGAGAGDGRGIHSDQSQDSSGRGTSLSSTASSGSSQSEAILIDPSAFIAHFEMMRELGNPSAVAPTITVTEAADTLEAPSTAHSHEYRSPRPQRMLPGTSDVEADVSSTDTDVPSDN